METFSLIVDAGSCTVSGTYCSMTNSFTHTTMEWLCAVTMESNDGSIQEFLLILQITPKSAYLLSPPVCIAAHLFIRVLLATIRDQGLCPCPRCLVPKSRLDQLRRVVDVKN